MPAMEGIRAICERLVRGLSGNKYHIMSEYRLRK